MTLSIEQAKQLKYGDELYTMSLKNSDGSPQRWRVNGKPKTWKTRPNDVKVPIKRGLREYAYAANDGAVSNLHEFTLNEDEAKGGR